MTAFFYLYFPAFLALAYGTVNALIGIVLSVIVYTLVNIVIVRAASRNGLTVALFSRSMFGFIGASIATLILHSKPRLPDFGQRLPRRYGRPRERPNGEYRTVPSGPPQALLACTGCSCRHIMYRRRHT